MAKGVYVKDQGVVEFPDETDEQTMLQSLRRKFSNLGQSAIGAGETALSIGSAALAEPVSGLAGLAGAALPGEEGQGARFVQSVGDAMTYEPMTEKGVEYMRKVAEILQPVGEVIQGASQNLGDKAYSATGSPALAAAAYSAPTAFLEGLGLKGLNIARKPVSGADLYTPRIFAGVKAKTADLAALDRAKALEAAGASRDQIWTETGWLNDGGDWKFEISDESAALSPAVVKIPEGGKLNTYKMSEALQHKALLDAYPQLKRGFLTTDPNMTPTDLGFLDGKNVTLNKENPSEFMAEYAARINSKLDPSSENFWQKSAKRDYESGDFDTLEEALAENKRWLDWDIDELNAMKQIYWNEQDIGTTIHELQHAIQKLEGFSVGGSPDMARGAVGSLYNQPRFTDSPTGMQDFMNEYGWARGMQDLDLYKRLGGEVEARKAVSRLRMSAEDRKKYAPWLDTDVPENEIIPYKK